MKDKKYIRIRDVAKIIEEITGETRDRVTIYYWIKRGIQGYHGSQVKLKTVKRVGVLYTTMEWIKDFLEGLG